MYLNARLRIGPVGHITVVGAEGQIIGDCFAADSDEGWLECFVTEQINGKTRLVVDSQRGEVVRYRVYRYFELVDRYTGEVLAESSSPVAMLSKLPL